MKKRRIIPGVIFVAMIGGAWFGYGEYSRKVKDLQEVDAQIKLKTNEIIAAFEKDEKNANAYYLDKVIAVTGNVKSVEKSDQGYYTVVLGDAGSMSSVRCSMDSVHVKEINGVSEGKIITVKGACTGFNADELLGSDVILNRCVVDSEK